MSKHDKETKEKIKNILTFIVNNFNEYDRMQELNEDNDEKQLLFSSENNFFKHNEKCLLKMTKDDIDFLNTLCNKIKDNKISITDMDNFVEWESDVIYFNKLGQLVIAHPR